MIDSDGCIIPIWKYPDWTSNDNWEKWLKSKERAEIKNRVC